jgi:valyl-tRNA synthetase
VKITPAHDPNDWELAGRHSLPMINILNPDGTLGSEVPEKYRGMTVKKARASVLEDLKSGGWFIKEENINHALGHCYRCHTIIEPFLSEQWFVRMKPLAEKALACWRRGEIIFYPKKWQHTYQHWLENIRDWCISRQLWWGHRIPAWDCCDCGKTSVSRNDLSACPSCGSANIEQDPDVLDTWFSSWLWPFSTLGWEGTKSKSQLTDGTDFSRFYPTTALITAYDIIFFWVARMIMAGLEFTGKAPFRDVYIHGLVRDKQGRKMSKSLGNGLDPLELVDEFGADSLKFTLAFMCAQGQDILIDKESFKMGSRFANKVWNASRYILMNLEGRNLVQSPELLPVDKWIYSRLNTAAKAMEDAFLSYRFNDAAQTAYEYFWNDFCDWYVEATKLSMKTRDIAGEDDLEKDRAATVLLDVLAESLRLLHPLLPFVTEEIYGKLPNTEGLLITAVYPQFDELRNDPEEEKNFAFLQEFVRLIRTLRSECTISPDKKLRVQARLGALKDGCQLNQVLKQNEELVKLLAGLGELEITEADARAGMTGSRPAGSIGLAASNFEIFVFIAEAVDITALKQKFEKDLERNRSFVQKLHAKLANEQFVKNAPQELVAAEKEKLQEGLSRTAKIEMYIQGL